MASATTNAAGDSLSSLAQGILTDVERLIGQQFSLIRRDLLDDTATHRIPPQRPLALTRRLRLQPGANYLEIVAVNLVLGLATIVVGATGRYWR